MSNMSLPASRVMVSCTVGMGQLSISVTSLSFLQSTHHVLFLGSAEVEAPLAGCRFDDMLQPFIEVIPQGWLQHWVGRSGLAFYWG